MKDAATRIETFFAALAPADLARLGDFYTPDAHFKDPFNEVRGIAAIEGIFRHMFNALDEPRFVITRRMVDDDQCFLVWEFRFGFKNFHKGVQQVVHGGSHLLLAPDGRIQSHRDYWDAAEANCMKSCRWWVA